MLSVIPACHGMPELARAFHWLGSPVCALLESQTQKAGNEESKSETENESVRRVGEEGRENQRQRQRDSFPLLRWQWQILEGGEIYKEDSEEVPCVL